MSIIDFAKKRPYLFWYISDLDNISESSVVEHILNFGDWKDFKEILDILGLENVAFIFRKQLNNKRNNYRPEIKNYFTLYFDKYVPAK